MTTSTKRMTDNGAVVKLTADAGRQPHPAKPHSFTIVDLFAGAGGISEGFRQAGFSIVAGSDNDPDAMATYAVNFPEAQSIVGDIRVPAIKERNSWLPPNVRTCSLAGRPVRHSPKYVIIQG